MQIIRKPLLAAALLHCGMTLAAPVVELKPDEVAAYVARNELVVLQFTSPDPACKYCVGADKTFDEAAAGARNPALKFARVQWPVWHKMPKFEPLISIGYIPRQTVFRGGKEMQSAGGRPENATNFLYDIEEILRSPPKPGRDIAAVARERGSATAAEPMSADQKELTRLMIRSDMLGMITSSCARLFPDQGERYQAAFQTWRTARKARLDQANMIMVTRTSRADAKETSALAELEKKSLQAWQVATTGAPLNRAPVAKDCDKIVAALPD